MSERRREGPDGFDELLRQWMQDDAPASAPEQILESLRHRAATTTQQSPSSGSSLLAGLAAAALAVAVIVLSVQLTSDAGRQEPSQTRSASGAPTASDAAAHGSPSPSPSPSLAPWSRAAVELPAENSSRIEAVARGIAGYVAVGGGGSVEGFGGALAWHSANGDSWNLTLDAHAERDDSQMVDVVATADGYVAVGRNFAGVPVWLSADGLAWREAVSSSAPAGSSHSFNALAGGDEGLVAIGFTSENDAQIATAWSSTVGDAWTRLRGPDSYARAWPVDLAVADDGAAVIVGMTQPGEGDAVAWAIRQGVIGEPIKLPSDDPSAVVTAVVDTSAGFTAVGQGWDPVESVYRLLAWQSIDGETWVPIESETLGSPLGAAQIDTRGVVVVGATMGLEESEVRAWELSAQGEWQTFAVEASNGAGQGVVEGPDGRLLIVGSSDPDGEAVVWIEP